MGQPPPPNGPQGPFPGQPGQPGQPPQGPPPGYGQQPPQGPPGQYPPPGMPPQGPPPGYGQQPPQGMPPQGPPPGYGQQGYGQQPPHGMPPQGPPGQYPPPGYGPQPGEPKKKTGLIIGAAVGVVVLIVAIGGVVVLANASGEYVSLPDDCGEAIGDSTLSTAFAGSAPQPEGGFEEGDPSSNGRYGSLTCQADSGDRTIDFNVDLFDPEHPDSAETAEDIFGDESMTEEFLDAPVPQGELTEEDFGFGLSTEVLWDETSVGDQGVAMAVALGGGEDFLDMGIESYAVGAFVQDNIAASVMISDAESDLGAQELYDLAEAVTSDLARQLPRVAD